MKTKKCGLVIRVSTNAQAENEEGSLKYQLKRLHAQIKFKNDTSNEKWIEAEKYILEGVSGKDSVKSEHFRRLFQDIESGKVNTIICTELDRVSRSVKDFLDFFEELNKHNTEFICLRQNIDTTTAHGKFTALVFMALAEFERGQDSERSKISSSERAKEGLWTGGQPFLGYDFDPNKKGNLIPNAKEKIIVNFAFDYYLKCGSIFETTKELNRRGYRTKEFITSDKKPKHHPAREFAYSTVRILLTNYAYIGKKEINKKFRDLKNPEQRKCYKRVNAIWNSIIEEEKFYRVQKLIEKNNTTKHNVAKPIKHNYIFNGGLLWCAKCNHQMEGRSGTGKKGVRYYYYICKNCKFKISATEIEKVVINRIKELAKRKDVLPKLINVANGLAQKELPQLRKQKELLEKELNKNKNLVENVIKIRAKIVTDKNALILKDELNKFGKRRQEIENGISSVQSMIEEIEGKAIGKELIKVALDKMKNVFNALQPYEQKELVRNVLHKAILAEDEIKIGLYGKPSAVGLALGHQVGRPGGTRTPNQRFWRPLL